MNAERPRIASEAFVAAVLAALVLALLGGAWLRGLSVFWSDLTYLHHGWRAAPAMLVATGRAPLWEPSLYFGMPMAGSMQGGLFYPATIFYYLFGFATATALFQAMHLFTAGWLCALWLRSCRLSWGASLGGAVLFAFGGVMIARLPFLNHLATLAWAPALALFFKNRPVPLALVLTLMVLAGYPTFIPGCALVAWIAAYATRTKRWTWGGAALDWTKAGLLSGLLAAAQLLSGLELAAHSRRSAGVGLEEALTWGFAPHDLLQWIGPMALGVKNFHPAVDWTLCVYLGIFGAAAAAYGAFVVPRRRALILIGAFSVVIVLTLGASNPLSAALWRGGHSPLRFVRYPGNLAYLALLPLTALAAAGFSDRRAGPVLVLLSALELLVLGRSATPLATRELFVEPGPLVRALQLEQGDARYLISPKALQAAKGSDIFDWKQRLYGLTNAPYRLRAAANFGEPLVPAASYAVMDALLSLPSADAAAAWMPWIGATRLLTPGPANSARLTAEPTALWNISKARGPVSLAYRLTSLEGAALPASWPSAPPNATRVPLAVRREREDRFDISGEGAGWAYVAEPRFPGWTTVLSVPGGEHEVLPLPALGAFQKIETPSGPWSLRWRYEPGPWHWGLLLACMSWLMLAWSWYHRAVAFGDIR